MLSRHIAAPVVRTVAVGAIAFASTVAEASEPSASVTTMAADERAYYQYERNTAYTFVGVGVVSAAAGGVLATRDGDFARGMGWSVLSLGVLQAVGAGLYKFQVDALDERFASTLARDPAAFKREEGDHIRGTTSRFVVYRLSELFLALGGIGVATYGFVAKRDLWKGIGVGVGVEAVTFLTIDSFGTAKAHEYRDKVGRFTPEVAFQMGGGERPWAASVRWVFLAKGRGKSRERERERGRHGIVTPGRAWRGNIVLDARP